MTDKQLIGNKAEAQLVNHIYSRYLVLSCVRQVKHELDGEGKVSKIRHTASGISGGQPFSQGALYQILKNPLYIGKVSHKGELFEGKHTEIVPLALWEQVQSKLCSNRHQRKTRADAQEASLLAGLIEDDASNPMSPAHTRKGNRRYRYYLSQALLQFKKDQAGSVTRVSANDIEPLITRHLLAQLSNAHALLSMVDTRNLSADQQAVLIKNGESLSNQWSTLERTQRITYIQAIIHKIT